MFATVVPDQIDGDGTEEKPLVLQQVAAHALKSVLTMIYAVWGDDAISFSDDEYVEILGIAHKFDFSKIYHHILQQLPSRLEEKPLLRLQLALSHCGVDEWGYPAFRAVVCDLDAADKPSDRLGAALWMRIYRARLELYRTLHSGDYRCDRNKCPTYHERDACKLLKHTDGVVNILEWVSADDPKCQGSLDINRITRRAWFEFLGTPDPQLTPAPDI
ncbi:hypothetical protein BKA62DRAFT_624725 [Auriculariales sp. MPI-PUGE-AT-0066]|nr:hypothetical protein BKA62DRAFT_624725 [Auriculariales sp. MPI-PUGE-AT-0066]